MLPRTQRQKEILDYITRFLERHGYVPSYTQIARQFGVKSRATIAKHIAALEKRGLLTREHEDGSFALNVKVEDTSGDSLCEVKLLGRIAAGAPLEGANSFTEGQAKDRAEAAGFTEVSSLSKDDKGIWRGTAKRGASEVKIAVDFKGNVVAQ